MRLLLLFVLAAVAAACGGDANGKPLDVARVDTLPGGIVQVTNAGPTAWADTNGWRLVEERYIQPGEGEPGEIGKARTLVAGADGSVYLQESSPVRIRVYGPDGQWVRDIGREGDGPGEFRDGMFTIAGDVLVVQDPNNQRMTTLRTSGDLIASSVSQCCWWTSKFPAFRDSTVGILGPPPPAHKDRQGALYITHVDGRVVDTILLPPRTQREMEKENWTVTLKNGDNVSMMGLAIPLRAGVREAYFPTRQKVVGFNGAYTLAITGLHGDTLRLFQASAPTWTITTAQRDSIYEEEVTRIGAEWREPMRAAAKASDIPTTRPAWTDLIVDGASRIWVMRPDAKGAEGILDVFTPEGVLLGSVPVPHKEILQGYWTADHVYLLSEDAQGLPRIVVYRIETK